MDSDIERVQVNGQRRARRLSGSESEGGFEIFIQNLPHDMFEEELWPILERFGEILELRIMVNFSGFTRGFAYAKYCNQKSAREAISGLHCCEIRPGHVIHAKPSLDKKELYIGNHQMRTDEVIELIKALTANIDKINVCGKRGIVVAFKTHRDAAAARRILIPNKKKIFCDNVVIEWASDSNKVAKHPSIQSQNITSNPRTNLPVTSNQTRYQYAVFPQGRPIYRTYNPPGPLTFPAFPTNQIYHPSRPLSTDINFFAAMNWYQHHFL